jgi:molybdenum cofactor synthesis domain-containing protein
MKSIETKNALGLTICHDITEIIVGEHKKVAFKRGHVVRSEDIPHLLRLGKEHLFVWSDNQEGWLHEDEAARRITAAISGPGVVSGAPAEGRINLKSSRRGLAVIDLDLLEEINSVPDVTVATIHTMREVTEGRLLAGTRVVPLCVPETAIEKVEELCLARPPLITVRPFESRRIGVVATGGEVYHGRVKDGFGPILKEKFAHWGGEIIAQTLTPDDPQEIARAIEKMIDAGAAIVAVTGGMSVDPDDKTPAAIRTVSTEIVTYGAPVYPGAMFMLGYRGDIAVMGLPGCVMYARASIFDLIAPRIMAGLRLSRRDFIHLAHGGLCENCPECHYPNCVFGKSG